MKHEEFFLDYKTHQIFCRYWLPKESKAIVLLAHGMGEHAGRYTEYVIPELLAKHISVITYDNFGHGKSSGKRGHCPSYEALLNLFNMMLSKSKEIAKDLPVFLYGHSMGGNIVINYALRYQPEVVGVILSSPFLRLSFLPPAWKMTVGKLLQKIAPSMTLASGLDVDALSRIPEEVEKYQNDPLVHDRISPNYSFPVIEAGESAIQNASKLNIPVLIFHGTEDQLTSHLASKEFSERTPNAKLFLFDGGYHELHKDLEKEKVVSTIVKWIQAKL